MLPNSKAHGKGFAVEVAADANDGRLGDLCGGVDLEVSARFASRNDHVGRNRCDLAVGRGKKNLGAALGSCLGDLDHADHVRAGIGVASGLLHVVEVLSAIVFRIVRGNVGDGQDVGVSREVGLDQSLQRIGIVALDFKNKAIWSGLVFIVEGCRARKGCEERIGGVDLFLNIGRRGEFDEELVVLVLCEGGNRQSYSAGEC